MSIVRMSAVTLKLIMSVNCLMLKVTIVTPYLVHYVAFMFMSHLIVSDVCCYGNLNRKHSSGDLQSRLKTRKLLGVGETDDGDVHRSKLSQILGHSDQLYLRLPAGLRLWQFCLAITFTIMAAWALVFPSHLFETETEIETHSTLPARLYGTALISMSLLYWGSVQCLDRDTIRISLLTSVIYFSLQTLFSACTYSLTTTFCKLGILALLGRVGFVGVSIYFYLIMNREWRQKEHLSRNKMQEYYYAVT